MSLADCIQKAGSALVAEDKAAILSAAGEYEAAGIGADEAAMRAVDDQLAVVRGLLGGEAGDAAGGRAPAPAGHVEADAALWKRVTAGEATPDEFKAGFEAWVANKPAILAEFDGKKKDELLKAGGAWFAERYKSAKKADVAEALWRDGMSAYVLGRSYSYGMGSDSQQQAVRRMVEATDAAQLAQYVADRKAEQEQALARVARTAEAIKDPKTLADYQTWMRATMEGGKNFKEARMMLTPEQRAAYDELAADSTRSSRKVTQDTERTTARAAGQTTAGEIIATKHTRDGHDLWVVKLSDRVSKDDYTTLLAGAKRLGGNYSSFRGNGAVPGFQFRSPETAQAFLKLAGGDTAQATEVAQERRNAFEDDRSQSAAERLTEMAARLDERADESLGRDRKANTARRARFAASAEASASADKAMAKTMRNIASAIAGGGAKFLDRVRQKVQVELLQAYVGNAKSEELRAKYPTYAEQGRHKGEPPTFETADYAEFPTFTAYRSDLASLGRQLLEVDGTKKMGERIMKVADDVSDAFTAWANEPGNFAKVATFRAGNTPGGIVGFSTGGAAERSIARSGYRGKAIPFNVKRGAWTVIMSPSEAMARGIWKGDGDKRITLDPDFAGELVEKIGRASRRGAKVSVPWQFESAYDRRKQLARMGIETPAEFRAALREFIAMREQPAEADKIKAMERAMVGRRNDGLDFFPTPEGVADEMVAAADIQPGMRVLEPSAGTGHIAERIRATGTDPDVLEFSGDRRELLEAKGFNVVGNDFLAFDDANHAERGATFGDLMRAPDGTTGILRGQGGMGSDRVRLVSDDTQALERGKFNFSELDLVERRGVGSGYDRILMNPPFSDGRDIQHVRHAYDLLKPGGRLVAIMGESAFFNQAKRAVEFREWLESVGGTDEKLPEGTFNDPSLPVTTGANARMVVIEKPTGETGPRSIIDGPGIDAQFSRAPGRSVELEAADAAGREFWRKIDNGESFTDQEVLDALSINRRGSRRLARGMRSVADQAGTGTAAVSWDGDLASFGAYTSRASWDGDNFNVFFIPDSIAGGADLNDDAQARDKALVHASFKSAPGGGYELSLNDPQPGSTALAAAESAGISAQAGTEAKRYAQIALNAGDVTSRMVLQEAARRLALNIGRTPDVMYAGRDTGARTGKNTGPVGYNADTLRDKFSRTPGPRPGVPMSDAKAVVAAIRQALPTAPEIVLHDSVRSAPESLRELTQRAGAANDVEAAYHEGKIHVFPGNISSVERMQFVVAHHEVRHHGLRSMLGPQMGPAMLRMYASNPKLKAAADAKMAAGLADTRAIAAEEALADMPVEELQALTGWARIVAAARQWLRQAAAKLRSAGMETLADAMEPNGWTDNDIAALVQRAEDVSRGGAAPFRTGGGTVFQRAYHGTPYRGIERFSTDAIGTGEGAQAYGWGLYFASKREVADFYRRKLSGESDREFTKGGRTIQGPADLAEAYYQPGRIVRGYSGADKVLEFKRTDNGGWAVKVVGAKANGDPMEFERPRWHATQPDGNTLRDVLENDGWQFSPAGQLYEVEVPDDNELLLWDKPLSAQSDAVRQRLLAAMDRAAEDGDPYAWKTETGEDFYRTLQAREGSDQQASEWLQAAGVKGIKYLDGSSRRVGDGTFNYVIFSGDDAAIMGAAFSRRADQTQTPASSDIRFSRSAGTAKTTAPDWITSGSAALQGAAGKIDTYAPQKTMLEKAREMSAGWQQKLVQGMFDAYAPLKALSMDAYIAARMTKAADGAFEGMLMYGKPVMNADGGITGDLDGKGFLGAMRELNGEHDRFFMWLAGNRAERLLSEGKENLFNADEIAAMKALNRGTMDDGRPRIAAFKRALDEFNTYSKSVLDVAEKAGLIDGESRKLWEHDFYVPFYRMSQENEISGPTKIKGLVRQKAFERLKGGKENLGDLMDNTLRNWSHLLSASLANVAASKSLLAAEQAGIAIEAKEAQAKEMAKAAGLKGNATYFMDQGLQRWFVVEDPAVLQAVSALEAPALNGLPLQLMAKFKKYLTVGVTIAPAFKVRNLIRDTLAAPAANEMSFNIAKNLSQGWKATDTKTDGYAQMLFSGGLMRFGNYLEGDRAEHVKQLIAAGVDDKTILNTPQKVKAMFVKAWDAWQDFGDRMENVNRTALYQQLLDKGLSPREAAFQARDMMDFSLQGSWAATRTLTAVIPFLNARAQGLYKLGRAAADNPKRMGYMVAAVSLASIILMLAYEDDEDWKAREDWDRDAWWWFKIGDTAYRIPKPFEIGAMGTIAERSLELVINDEMTGARFAERMKQMVTGTFAINPVPQMFKPMMDLYANKDSFTGRQIETLGMERLSKPERYGPNTSALAKALGSAGEYTGISPVQVDHMIRAYFGWLGTMGAATVDAAVMPFEDMERPAKKVDDYFGGFVKELPAASSRYLEDFYTQAQATSEAMADLRRAREVGDTEKAAEIMEERGDKVALYRVYQQAQRQLADLNKRIRLVRGDTSMDGDTKRLRLDELTELRNRIARQVSDRTRAREAVPQ